MYLRLMMKLLVPFRRIHQTFPYLLLQYPRRTSLHVLVSRILVRVIDQNALDILPGQFPVPISHVAFAVRLGRESVIAQRALVRPVAVVGSEVTYQRRFIGARVGAHVARVRHAGPHPHVRPVVTLQSSQVREYGGAKSAGKLSFQLHLSKLRGERVLCFLLVVLGRVGARRAGRAHAWIELDVALGRACVRSGEILQYRAGRDRYYALYIGQVFPLFRFGQCGLVLEVQTGEEVVPPRLAVVRRSHLGIRRSAISLVSVQRRSARECSQAFRALELGRLTGRWPMQRLLAHGSGYCREFVRREVDEREIVETDHRVSQIPRRVPYRVFREMDHETVQVQHAVVFERQVARVAFGGELGMTSFQMRLQEGASGEVLPPAHGAIVRVLILVLRRFYLRSRVVQQDLVPLLRSLPVARIIRAFPLAGRQRCIPFVLATLDKLWRAIPLRDLVVVVLLEMAPLGRFVGIAATFGIRATVRRRCPVRRSYVPVSYYRVNDEIHPFFFFQNKS